MTGRNGGAELVPIEPSPVVILVRPQMAENIGAAARAMGNGGLFHLRLVAPRDGWPLEKAWRMASGAHRILDAAQVFESVAAAVADLHRVFVTCPRPRHIIKPVLTARGGAAEAVAIGARGLRCGVLFGPERTGLDNDDIACADSLIRYDLNPGFMSLNLAQAVMIFGYEWWLARQDAQPMRAIGPSESDRCADQQTGADGQARQQQRDADPAQQEPPAIADRRKIPIHRLRPGRASATISGSPMRPSA